ncbi:DUF1684 domain-containing protein [Angustibacter luteus]|uniref:DUF1684 domain-containing protein n=1 Tax=Angustibacter luteus TaxID=658456 RepID=A0ABW1JF82_9ACTN
MTSTELSTAADVVDWRRRVHALYRAVRETAEPRQAHEAWRRGRDQLLASHPASPLLGEHRAGFSGLAVAEYDERYRFEVAVTEPDPSLPSAFKASTATDGDVPFARLGTVVLPAPEGEVRLDVWRLASYGGGIFLPVKDAAPDSYGGGRYVLDTIKGSDLGTTRADDGTVTLVVDLNFAYNPSCAYDPEWACPLPQQGNRTAVPLPVGEQHRGAWVDY